MKHLYPIITTASVRECRDFYVHALGARVLFEQDWYVHLSIDGWEIGFLSPRNSVRLPVFRHATQSRGLCIALEVGNVRQMYEEFQRKDIEIFGPLEELAGGELVFSVMDPSGAVINIVERSPDAAQMVEI
ncbi:MAG TPA: VOC family protein [Nevskiaceae bacterium]|nr:VOC family protein [Nevskiaceae bacterium]